MSVLPPISWPLSQRPGSETEPDRLQPTLGISTVVLANAFHSMPYPAFVADQAGYIIFANRRAKSLLWASPPKNTQSMPQHLANACTWDETEIPNRIMRGAASGTLTIPLISGNHAPRVTGTRFRAMTLRSDVPGQMLVLLTQDILTTATRALAELKSQSQKAKKREEELKAEAETLATNLAQMETFTQAASHDIRGPLGNLKTLIEMFSAKYGHALPDDAARHLDVILQGTQRLNGVSDGLLNHALAGASELVTEPVDLDRILRDVLIMHQADIDAAGAEFKTKFCDVAFVAETTLLHSLMGNLVSNALKNKDASRRLKVRIATYVKDAKLYLSVKDNGQGFDPAHLERMFKPFQRLSTDTPGHGLGLSTCSEICKRHGWKISAHGVPGVGAEFTVQTTGASRT